jgi:hypothetical protein
MAALDSSTSGRIVTDGVDISDLKDKDLKAGDDPAGKPGEPCVTTVHRRIELHLLAPSRSSQSKDIGPQPQLQQFGQAMLRPPSTGSVTPVT